MSRRVEMNPGELFMVADRSILVHEYESVIGDVAKIGGEARVAYLLTFTGRINNSDEDASVTVILPPEDAFALAGNIIDGIGLLVESNKQVPR